LQPQQDRVLAEVDQLAGTSTGYIVPHWEWVVRKTISVAAQFVVGADGQRSLVRRLLGIQDEQTGPSEFYVVYEFDAATPLADELCVVLDPVVQSVCWPLAEGRCRWSFQLPDVQTSDEFQDKDRSPVWSESPATAGRTLARLKKRLAERAPWFPAVIRKVDWAMDIQFRRRMAREFGRDRCWLAGDAAHQTSPAGIQSMNAGLLEGEDLAARIVRILKHGAAFDGLREYGLTHRESWRRLLGASGYPAPTLGASAWVRENAGRIVPTIPATGNDLAALLAQLGLAWT
jgi:3-(3-hydroxy-phenyl)propionate hydroxylase